MKIKDLLESRVATFPTVATSALPGVISSPGMDQYYDYYRFLVALAGFPEKDIAVDGPVHDGPVITPYTSIEQEHSIRMLQKMGKSVKFHNISGSHETEKRNTVSPVRKFVDPDGAR